MSPAQREALVGIATSDAALTVLVGAAGTGKSHTAAVLDAAWRDLTGTGRVVAVGPTQVSADVLAEDGVAHAANVAAFLAAHDRLSDGRPLRTDTRWQLGPTDVLLVDEASMVATPELTRLTAIAQDAGARVVLMGDAHQLGAVGAGGMLRAAIDRDAETYTLTDVRRFTADWERDASLRLRDGDPDAVVDYDAHGRLIDAGTAADAVAAIARAAAADRLDGRDVVVVTATNDHAATVNAAVRRHLAAAGLVEDATVLLGRDGTACGVGDLVQARRIDRDLGLINRQTYTVTATTPDGALRGRLHPHRPERHHPRRVRRGRPHPRLRLHRPRRPGPHRRHQPPAAHPRHGPRRRLRRPDPRTHSNTAWAITHPSTAADLVDPDQPVTTARGLLAAALTDTATGAAPSRTPGHADAAAVDVTAADDTYRAHGATLANLLEDESRIAARQRLDADLDTLVADGLLPPPVRARLGADQGSEHLARLLRAHEQAGADPLDVLRAAVTDRPLDDARSVAQVLAHRIDVATPLPAPTIDSTGQDGAGAGERAGWARVPADRAGYLDELGDLLADRRRDLAAQAVADQPGWAATVLGPLPEDPADRAAWQDKAGTIALAREATGWDHPDVALGRSPGVHTPEKRSLWNAAYTAAGMPTERRPETEMTDGRLLIRVRAAETARANLPAAVHDAQRERHHAAETERRDAVLARADGRTAHADAHDLAAAEHAAAADRLDQIATARGHALVAHAETFAAGEAARAELLRRGLDTRPRSRPDHRPRLPQPLATGRPPTPRPVSPTRLTATSPRPTSTPSRPPTAPTTTTPSTTNAKRSAQDVAAAEPRAAPSRNCRRTNRSRTGPPRSSPPRQPPARSPPPPRTPPPSPTASPTRPPTTPPTRPPAGRRRRRGRRMAPRSHPRPRRRRTRRRRPPDRLGHGPGRDRTPPTDRATADDQARRPGPGDRDMTSRPPSPVNSTVNRAPGTGGNRSRLTPGPCRPSTSNPTSPNSANTSRTDASGSRTAGVGTSANAYQASTSSTPRAWIRARSLQARSREVWSPGHVAGPRARPGQRARRDQHGVPVLGDQIEQ